MNSSEKEITYQSANSYSTLNTLTEKTERIWFACHGMGYLSRYFLKYFKELDTSKNYIIAPQAPSKYYQQPKMHVGANWLTRDNTSQGMQSIMNYFDKIFEVELLPPKQKEFVLLGYSQGVSVMLRYMAKREIQGTKVIIHSGGIPKELKTSDFNYLSQQTEVKLVYGTSDEFLDEERIRSESKKAKELFGDRLEIVPFEGSHVVNVNYINSLV